MTRGLPIRSLFVFLLFLACSLLISASALAQTQPPGPARALDDDTNRPVIEFPPDVAAPPSGGPTGVGSSPGGPTGVGPSPDDAPRAPTTAEVYWPWTRLVYYGPNDGQWDIYYAEANGGLAIRMTDDPAAEITPDLARGGGAIAYANNTDGDFDIWIMNLQTAGTYPITGNDADDGQPVWSPDNSHIAFVSDRDGQPEIYTIRPDGSDTQRLTFSAGYDGDPTWSPDGTRIIFSSNRTGNYRLYVMNADGSGQTQINDTAASIRPSWSVDGARVAYSADGDGDGWLEIHLHYMDGRPGHQLMPTPPMTDSLVSGWSPDGQTITYTDYDYLEFEGELYIGRTFMRRVTPGVAGTETFPAEDRYPFAPVLESIDAQPPQSWMKPLPATSPAQVIVGWDGTDNNGSLIATYDVQIQIDDGPWTDWQMAVPARSASYAGRGGQHVAFRVRAIDNALNQEPWRVVPDAATIIEQLPPQTAVLPLNSLTRAGQPIHVRWLGNDPGGSGISAYQVQYRIAGGLWVDWALDPLATEAEFAPEDRGVQMGQTVAFRVRGVDAAANQEDWPPGNGDTATMLYRWAASGTVRDNTGTPINGANVTTDPAALFPSKTGGNGTYQLLGGAETASAALSWAKPAYGPLPATPFSTNTERLSHVVLPPSNDLIIHGGFEQGWPDAAWAPSGALPVVRSGAGRITGGSALTLGQQADPFAPTRTISTAETQATALRGFYLVDENTRPISLWENPQLHIAEQQAGGTWTVPANLYDRATYATYAAQDGLGGLHVILSTIDGSFYYHRPAGGTWSAPETVPYSDSNGYTIAADSHGNVHFLWDEYDFENEKSAVFYGRRNTAGGWLAPETVETSGFVYLNNISMAISSDGVVYTAWTDWATGPNFRVMARHRPPAGGWQPPVVVSDEPTAESGNVDLVADSAGGVSLTWNRHSSKPYQDEIMLARGAGGQWSLPEVVVRATFVGGWKLAHSTTNQPRLVYLLTNANGSVSLLMKERRPGGWAPPRPVDEAPYIFPANLVVDKQDRTHVAYSTNDHIAYRRMDPSGAATPIRVVAEIEQNHATAHIAVDDAGLAYLSWRSSDQDVELQDVHYVGPVLATADGEATVSQQVTIPADMANPVLSFFYTHSGRSDDATNFTVTVGDSATRLPLQTGATHHWLDLSAFAGQTVPVTFRLQQAAGVPMAWATLDDVSLGSAHPDTWLRGSGDLALGGETAELTFTIGNRAGIAAANARLSVTLPPDLTFISATPAPTTTTGPYEWMLGDLPPATEQTIVVRVAVSPGAEPFSELPVTASVSTDSELETHNNGAATAVGVWRTAYLPGITRP